MRKNPFTIIFGVEPESMIPRNTEYLSIINDFESSGPVSFGYVITGVRGYPYAFQILGTLLWDADKKTADEDILKNVDAMLYDGSYKAIWEHLSAKEKRILIAIAHSNTSEVKEIRGMLGMESNQFSPYRENLKENGLISADTYGKIEFKLPRFKEFVLRIERYEMM